MKLILAAALAFLLAFPVQAAPNCAGASDVAQILKEKYGESVFSRALSKRGYVLEMWVNLETGTWTAVVQRSDGLACIVDEGEAFQMVDEAGGEPL